MYNVSIVARTINPSIDYRSVDETPTSKTYPCHCNMTRHTQDFTKAYHDGVLVFLRTKYLYTLLTLLDFRS